MIPTLAQLLAMMATMECHTTSINIPERRETLAYTVCIKIEVKPPEAITESPPLKEKPVVKKVTKKKVTRCKRRYYWKNHHKRWRCVR
jgi:hypothetical protein